MAATRLLCFGLILLALGPRVFADGPSRGELPDSVAKLVEKLDAPDWKTRDLASSELMGLNPDLLEPLRSIERSDLTTEASLRLKRVARELYFCKMTRPAPACLGIVHTPSVDWRLDPRVAPGFYALRIQTVLPNTSASRAGLKPGDLVIGMNGGVATSPAERDGFTGWIYEQRPGTPCEFTVLRDIRGRLYLPGEERGIDRRGFRELDTRVVESGDDDRLPAGAIGLKIVSARGADERLALQAGDLIVAIDGAPLPLTGAKEMLESWARTKTPDQPDQEEILRRLRAGGMPGPNLRVNSQPSVQVLRGGRRLQIHATLGRWPLNIDASGGRRELSTEQIQEISTQFDRWWCQSDKSALPSAACVRDPSLYWQMEP